MSAPTAPPPHGRRRDQPAGIVTPEAVLLEFAEAGLGSRALAFLLDLAVRIGIVWFVLVSLGMGGLILDETLVVVVLVVTGFGVLLVYPVVCETVWNGRTPGKMLVGLRVVTVEGAPVRLRHAAVRAALGMVDFLVGAGSVAVLSTLLTRHNQRLGDLAAGTIVIRERQAARSSQPVLFAPPPGWERFAASLDVTGMRDDQYVLIRSLLLRVHELRAEARTALTGQVATRVASAIGVSLPPGTHPEAFLVAVAAAYQHHHGGGTGVPAVGVAPPPPGAPPPVWVEDQPPAAWGGVGSTPGLP